MKPIFVQYITNHDALFEHPVVRLQYMWIKMERRHLHDPENICHTASKVFQKNAGPNIYIYIISTIVSRIKNQS